MEIAERAQRLADELLFPAAPQTDAADAVPRHLFDALADAGLYGLARIDDLDVVCAVTEALASGCLATAFVWAQHLGAARSVLASENPALAEWVEPLLSGARRAGLALGGAVSGPPRLVARPAEDGWRFDGFSPFVSGWGLIDVVHAGARTEDGRVVWALVNAVESPTLSVERLRLAALDATVTVQARFHEHVVPAARVTVVAPYAEGPTPPPVLRIHAALALGVASRCCRLLGPSPLDAELAALRVELDRLDPETIEAARAASGELALRAAAALATAQGSRSLLAGDHAERLVREALFALVYALRPGVRTALLARLGAS